MERAKVEDNALSIVRNCCKHSALDPVVYRYVYAVQQRRGKLLLCLQALMRLWRLGGEAKLLAKLCPLLAHFAFKADLEAAPETVRNVVLTQLSTLLGVAPLRTLASLRTEAAKWMDSVEARLRSGCRLNESVQYFEGLVHAGREDRIKAYVEKIEVTVAFPLKECQKMLDFLTGHAALQGTVETFRSRCRRVYPRARALEA